MVASVTRMLFVAWFAIVLALVACGAHLAWPLGIRIALLVLVFGHPLVQAIEFALAWRVGQRTGGAHPPLATLARAWLREWQTSVIVFGWRLPWRSNAWPDHLPRSARGLRGVVFIHGFICNRGIWNPWLKRLTRQDRAFVAVDLEPVFGDIDGYVDAIASAVRRVESVTGLAPLIVAHSMGGLVARAWLRTRTGLATNDGQEPAARVITIGTPHRGTWLADLALASNAKQMRASSDWMGALRDAEPADRGATFTCWWSECDQIVFPMPTAVLPDSESHQLRGVGHVALIDRPEIWAELRRRLDQ